MLDGRRIVVVMPAYRAGRTPNPCLRCNRMIKFGALYARADALGCSHVAMGHYVRLETLGGRLCLRRAVQRLGIASPVAWAQDPRDLPFVYLSWSALLILVPLVIALFVIAFGIATIIIWAMMGRVIADSRRETAVFRAIGAKRSDIVAVYLTYSLWVALRIVLVAALIAVGIAAFVEFRYADRATDIARLAYAVFTPAPRFSFIGLQAPLLWGIFAGIIAMIVSDRRNSSRRKDDDDDKRDVDDDVEIRVVETRPR